MYDTIIVGAGVAGCIAARELAERGGERVCIIEKRAHIGGNCYDVLDEYGVLIHKYGPHIFHTRLEHIYSYFSRFTRWHSFDHEVVANIHGRLIPVPFNLHSLHMVFEQEKADRIEKKLTKSYPLGSRVPILELKKSPDEEIRELADYVYQNVFLYYTMKQWGQKPEEIDPGVTARVPVLIDYDNRYFQEPYQGMPADGYTTMFKKMLDYPGIDVRLQCDAADCIRFEEDGIYVFDQKYKGRIIFTGAVDEFLGRRFGLLPYRTLHFAFEHYEQEDYQGHSVVNYTVDEEYTRITEFKHLTGQQCTGTTIVKEYPAAYKGGEGEIPYYSIQNEVNEALYEKYKNVMTAYPGVYLLGRLAEYKYYNIDAMADRALRLVSDLLKEE